MPGSNFPPMSSEDLPMVGRPVTSARAVPIRIELEVVRAGSSNLHVAEVSPGAPLRSALRAIGQAAEGCAVLDGDRPIPLDTPLLAPARFTVLPTFSGG